MLIGRQRELSLLLDAMARPVDGIGGVVVVSGEGGVGKSRLVRELATAASVSGRLVLSGRAVSSPATAAFRPFSEAVLGELRRPGRGSMPELGPFKAVLGQLVPEWAPQVTVAGADSPVLVGEGLIRLLRRLGGERGCLLVLEDLQWADRESLAVLEYVADNVRDERIFCLGTVRPGVDGSLPPLLGVLADRRVVEMLALEPLDGWTTIEVARACLGADNLPETIEAYVRDHADGLPFLVEELLAVLVGAGVLVRRRGEWTMAGPLGSPLPATFLDGVQRRLDALPAPTRRVLQTAAVIGRQFDWSLLPAATGVEEAAVGAALRRAAADQLVTVTPDEGFAFRHALTRDAVLAGMLPPERAAIARQALTAVTDCHPDLPDPWGELAAGLAESAGDRQLASALLRTVGVRAAGRGALATAEANLLRASELTDDLRMSTLIDGDLTDVLAQAGHADRAIELGNRLLRRPDLVMWLPSNGVELHLRIARAAVAAGRWPAAAEHLAAARSDPAARDGLAASLGALDAAVALGQGRLGDAERLAAVALTEAERTDQPAEACEALEVAGRVARQRDLEVAEAAFARELTTAAAHGLELWRLRAMHELGTIDQLRTESVERLQETRELAVGLGAVALVATLDLQIAAGLIKQFATEQGLAVARRCVDSSRRLQLATLPMALVHEAAAHAQRGRRQAMETCLDEALALAADDLDVGGSARGHCRAVLALMKEDRAVALDEMTAGAALLLQAQAGVAPPFLGLRVLLLAIDHDDDAAAAEAAEQVRASNAVRHRIVGTLVDCSDAVLLGRAGRPDAAADAWAAAEAAMGPLVDWYRHYARRTAAERALVDGWGDPLVWLREGASFFADRGDQQIAAACRSLLRRAGVVVPRTGGGHRTVPETLRSHGITSRELDVLELLVEGLTNAELGARLHLSPRTVEKHVASLLAKTGSRRRAQLAGYASRLGG